MESEQTNKFTIPLAIVAAGALIAGAVYFGGNAKSQNLNPRPETNDIEVPAVSQNDHYLGSRSAKVVIVEYSDTECPWCKVFHGYMHEITQAYGDNVAWVYRHTPFHSLASKEAEATECAAELGGNVAFWKYLDKIFEITPSNNGLNPDELPKIASGIGLDLNAFNQCLSSGKYMEKIRESLDESVRAEITGTPYSIIFVGGKRAGTINGAEPVLNIRAKIDPLLN